MFFLRVIVGCGLAASLAIEAKATEGAGGRYIPGGFAVPGAGVVPPAPGVYWAPTGYWKEGELAVVGMNYWSFSPTIGVTRLIPEHGIDLSAKFGIDINTENRDTDYYSGAMAHLDLAATKSVTDNLSFGAIAGFLYQFEDDDSAFANARADGFRGESIAIGPLIKYKAKFSEDFEVDFSLSWAHEVHTENRMEGDAVFFSMGGKF